MRWIANSCFALLLTTSASDAFACGVCVEDKIAAVYDHKVVTNAYDAGHQVVFCAIEGDILPGNTLSHKMRQVLESIAGVDRGSVRVSLDTASISFAFDPARTPRAVLIRTANRKLAINGIKLAQLSNSIERDQVLR